MHSKRSIVFVAACVLLLLGMFLFQFTSARTESQTVDEGAHLASGFSYWKTGDFRLNPEHPPLLKLIASVPLLFLNIQPPLNHPSWDVRDEWAFARELLYHNTIDGDTILLWGRIPMMMLALLLGILLLLWSKTLWGKAGALLSLVVFVFDPTIIAHSRYVTTDVGVTLGIFATVFFFGRYLDRPSRKRWWPVAICFGLANVAKFSATFLWLLLPILWALRFIVSDDRIQYSVHRAFQFFLSLVLSTLVIVFLVYGLELKPPLADPEFSDIYQSEQIWKPEIASQQPGLARLVLQMTNPDTPVGSFFRTSFASVPLPAYTYFRGLSSVVWHNYWGHSSYLLGDFRVQGWWYYFPVAFLVKTPLATLLLVCLSFLYLGRLFVDRWRTFRYAKRSLAHRLLENIRSVDFHYYLLAIPPVLYFAISCTSRINLGVRHLLPIYPFLFVLLGCLATVRFRRLLVAWRLILCVFLASLITSSLLAYPYYLSYFSELVGGPAQGARYLVDSNLDWGQELRRLGAYVRTNNIPFVYITYFGQAPLEQYLDDFRYLPKTGESEAIERLDGWAAISATALMNESGEYDWLRALHPTAKIGYAIFLYDLRKTTSRSDTSL
jgi:4-amino-4-deoxy-L-arabinose transferase-like glycosyltransferase